MDDFMGKPFTATQLAAALNRWLERQDVKVETARGPSACAKAETLDIALLRNDKSGKADRLVKIFPASAPKSVQQIMMAIVDREHARIGAAAQRLKSSSATNGALELARLAAQLEDGARTSLPIESCLMQAVLLQTELVAVEKALRKADWQAKASGTNAGRSTAKKSRH